MKNFRFIILSLVLSVSFNTLYSQKDTIVEDSALFLFEFRQFLEKSNKYNDFGKPLYKKLEEMWEEGQIDSSLRDVFYASSNALYKRRLRVYPRVYDWLGTTMYFIENDLIGNNFHQYQSALLDLCSREDIRPRHIYAYIETIKYLITKGHISENGSTIWKSDNKNFVFRFSDEEMKINFPNSTLTCILLHDSIKIHETSGYFNPIEKMWYGESARVYWDKAGYVKDSVFAEFGKYEIDMKLAMYEIDTAKFVNLYFSNKPFYGSLVDRVTESTTSERRVYPEFTTFDATFKLDNIFEDINYRGGLQMRGNRFLGTGSSENNAQLEIYRDVDKIVNGDTIIEKMLFMKVKSQIFSFNDEGIISPNAKICLRIENDSLHHPGLQFSYRDKGREINLLRSEKANNMSRSPYYNSFHRFEINSELVKWKIGDEKIYFTALQGSAISIAAFTSYNIFKKKDYYQFTGFDFTHPFVKIRTFSLKNKTRDFTALEISNVLRIPIHEARIFLLHLTYLGFVNYDNTSETGKINQKLFDYLEYVVGDKDYDIINIESATERGTSNAILNLKNLDILVSGIEQIHISDSQRVNIYPKHGKIVLHKNRDISFGGVIETGFYTFFGDGFHFDYEKFSVDLKKIDSVQIKVIASYDQYGFPIFKKVQSTIEDVTGHVFIDDPGNKSGLQDFPRYPIFQSIKDSYVYYDAPKIAGGQYKRDTFYFQIDPYEIDSLNSFDAQGLRYTGTFHPGNIFPAIEEELQIQPDNSLGIIHEIPQDGYPVYGGKGQFYDTLKMSNEGLEGSGKLTYLTTTSWSPQMKFYPDSMRTLATRFINDKAETPTPTPKIEGENIDILWHQSQEKMFCTTTEKDADMYGSQAFLNGTIIITPNNTGGYGKLFVERGSVNSTNYQFLANSTKADISSFSLKAIGKDDLAFEAAKIKTVIDYPSRIGTFTALSPMNEITFPINQYRAYVNSFVWNIDNENIALKGESVHSFDNLDHKIIGLPDKRHPRGALFVSDHPLQEQLNYISPNTDFTLTDNVLLSHNVKFLEIADATVYLGDGEFTVKPEARYKTLTKTRILADNDTKYHEFYDATVNVTSRKEYSGSGYYDYIDFMDTKQQIRFDIIGVDKAFHTYARGKILGVDEFTLSPAFGYRGDVSIYAPDKFLKYNGHFRLEKTCDMYDKRWVEFESSIDPGKVRIPIDSVCEDINDKRVYKGIMLEKDSIHILPRFFTPRNHYTDEYLTTATGVIQFDYGSKKYEIATETKLDNPDTTLRYISQSTETCNLYGSGPVSFAADLGQLDLKNLGEMTFSKERDELLINTFTTIDFFFNKQVLKYIADTLKNYQGLQPVDVLSDKYRKGLTELIGYKEADKLLNEQKLFGAYKKFPKELVHTFVISNAAFQWVQTDGSFHSFGDISVASIGDVQINKKFKGAIQIGPSRTGDYFSFYLEASPRLWFYFRYKRNILTVASSDPSINEMIDVIKQRDRKQKVERGEQKFYYSATIAQDKERFIKAFKAAEEEMKLLKDQKKKEQEEQIEKANANPVQEQKKPNDIKTNEKKEENKEENKEEKNEPDKNN